MPTAAENAIAIAAAGSEITTGHLAPVVHALIAAVMPVRAGIRRRTLLVLVAAACLARLGGWFDQVILSAAGLAVWTIIALIAAASGLRFALRARLVDREPGPVSFS